MKSQKKKAKFYKFFKNFAFFSRYFINTDSDGTDNSIQSPLVVFAVLCLFLKVLKIDIVIDMKGYLQNWKLIWWYPGLIIYKIIIPPEGWVIIGLDFPKVRKKNQHWLSVSFSSDPSYTVNSSNKQKTHPPFLKNKQKAIFVGEKKNTLPFLKNRQKTHQSKKRRTKELFFSFSRTTWNFLF